MDRTTVNINLLGAVTTDQVRAVLEPIVDDIMAFGPDKEVLLERTIRDEGWIELEEVSDVSVDPDFLEACQNEGVSFTWSNGSDWGFTPQMFLYNAEIGSTETWDTIDGEIVLTVAESANSEMVQRARDAEAFIAANRFVHAGETSILVSYREHATILAALRYWQARTTIVDMMDIATNGGAIDALDGDEIDALCERINA